MGGAVGFLPLLLVLLLATVLIVGWMVRGSNRKQEVFEEVAADPEMETLRYHVPEGQDPAAVAAALRHHGYEATTDHAPGHHDVLVACAPGSSERETVRRVIAEGAPLNLELDDAADRQVRFADE